MENSSQIRIELRDVSRWFGKQPGVQHVDLDIETGDSLGFVGPNGSGKTTLLKLLSGHYPPTTGRIHRYIGTEEHDSLDAQIGFAGHELMLYEQLTPRENLSFFAEMYDGRNVEGTIDDLLDTMRLRDRQDDPVSDLSSGMKKKLSICRALIHEPDLLLLDEPFRGIDASSSELTRTLLNDFKADGGTLLMSSHDLRSVSQLCDRVVVLADSEFQQSTSISDQNYEEFRKTYREMTSTASS